MPLHAPSPRRERILVFGYSGAGKSTCWTSWVQFLHLTRSTSRVFVLDTDRAWEAMRPADGSLDATVTVHDTWEWTDYRGKATEYRRAAGPDDLLVVDLIDPAYNKAKEGFIEALHGQSADAFYVDLIKNDEGMGGAYGKNWDAINKMYFSFMEDLSRFPGHVLACAGAKEVRRADPKTGRGLSDSPQILMEFGDLGFKPAGHKDLPHAFHTVLFMAQSPSGWRMTTAKERNPPGSKPGDAGHRTYQKGVIVESFPQSYLMKVAGWKP